jgi:ribose 5-phosphate isomerase B
MESIALGSNPNAAKLKEIIKEHLTQSGYNWEDYGSDDSIYTNVTIQISRTVAAGKHDRGMLMCGTGIGVCIAANKVPGIRAALCTGPYSSERAIKSNNANTMTLGSLVIGPELAKMLVTIWLQSEYSPGGPAHRSKNPAYRRI